MKIDFELINDGFILNFKSISGNNASRAIHFSAVLDDEPKIINDTLYIPDGLQEGSLFYFTGSTCERVDVQRISGTATNKISRHKLLSPYY